jgi:hypothetical protein
MKKIIFALLLMLVFSTVACYSASITLAWDYSADDSTLGVGGGYHLYQSKVAGVYSATPAATVVPGVKQVTVTVPNGTYFWVVTAFDNQGNESGYSNEVTAKVNPGKPNNLKIP